jgi:hypothetical protein
MAREQHTETFLALGLASQIGPRRRTKKVARAQGLSVLPADIAILLRAEVPRILRHCHSSIRLGDPKRVIYRAIIRDDDLEILKTSAEDRLNRFRQKAAVVKGVDADGNSRSHCYKAKE